MSGILGSLALPFLGVCMAVVLLFTHVLKPEHDPKEPPVIPQGIPYFGHIIGLFRYGLSYYDKISSRHRMPIYTLETLNKRTYVVNSPDLVNAVQRNTKTISFNPVVAGFIKRFSGVCVASMEKVYDNLNGEAGHWGLVIDTHDATYSALTPGIGLDHVSDITLQALRPFIDGLGGEKAEQIIDLYGWVRRAISLSSTRATYGPQNPFEADPKLVDCFWILEQNLIPLMIDKVPWLLARKAYVNRELLVEAFKDYFGKKGGVENSSALTKGRYAQNRKYDISTEDMARFEIGNLIAILANTTPTVYWLLVYIYSDIGLLELLREEVARIFLSEVDLPAHHQLRSLDVVRLRDSCPLLVSTYQEVLRIKSASASSRWVLEDTVLNDRYLLKKGSLVQMPSSVMHADESLWGGSADVFDAQRFLKRDTRKGEQKVHPGAFRAFGGGSSLCPGRHLATTGILAAAAMIITRFDVSPVLGDWAVSLKAGHSVASAIPPPASDIKVKVMKRSRYPDDDWGFRMSESKIRFSLTV